jgi:hypothetical protein
VPRTLKSKSVRNHKDCIHCNRIVVSQMLM